MPAPSVDVDRDASALADGADLDVAVEDAPALVVGVVVAAAGEGRHGGGYSDIGRKRPPTGGDLA